MTLTKPRMILFEGIASSGKTTLVPVIVLDTTSQDWNRLVDEVVGKLL